MISDEEIDEALEFLRSNARKAAQCRAERAYMEEYRRVVRAEVMREAMGESLGAQESRAYADSRYKKHLKAMQAAIEADEYHRWMMVSAQAKIEAWRTQQANLRAEGKAYS